MNEWSAREECVCVCIYKGKGKEGERQRHVRGRRTRQGGCWGVCWCLRTWQGLLALITLTSVTLPKGNHDPSSFSCVLSFIDSI